MYSSSLWNEDHGKICDECFQELVMLGTDVDLYEFMSSKKPKTVFADIEGSLSYWSQHFIVDPSIAKTEKAVADLIEAREKRLLKLEDLFD